MKQIKLSGRLKALADLVDSGASVADIGTDHGHLPVYLAQTEKACSIIASDISESSLDAARRTAAKYNLTKVIKFITAPGLDGVPSAGVDTVIISGMGGESILRILKDAPWTAENNIILILQPQSKSNLLFRFLYDAGYDIINVKYVCENRKCYIIIHASGR